LVKNDENARACTVCRQHCPHFPSASPDHTHKVLSQPGAHEPVVEVPAVSRVTRGRSRHSRDEKRGEEQDDSLGAEEPEHRLELGLPGRLAVRRHAGAVLSPD
jgi:hypothetical protein